MELLVDQRSAYLATERLDAKLTARFYKAACIFCNFLFLLSSKARLHPVNGRRKSPVRLLQSRVLCPHSHPHANDPYDKQTQSA